MGIGYRKRAGQLFAFIMGVLVSQSAFAIHGEDVMESDLASRSCMFLSRNGKTGEILSLCTANVVTPTALLSAGHCVLTQKILDLMLKQGELSSPVKEEDVQRAVFCGSKYGRAVVSARPVPNYEFGPFAIGDLAVVKVAEKDAFPVDGNIDFPNSLSQTSSLIKRGDCRTVGFGQNDGGSANSLHMTKPELPQDDFAVAGMKDFIVIGHGKNSDKFAIDHGDSGGGLYCRDEAQKWWLVGINSKEFTGGVLPMATTISGFSNVIREMINEPQ